MSKTKIILVLLSIIALGGLSLYLNRDWFAPETIQISHRVSPWMKRTRTKRANDLGDPVTFTLGGYYRLTNLKVVLASDGTSALAAVRLAQRLAKMVTPPKERPADLGLNRREKLALEVEAALTEAFGSGE
jgi:hypothetical protein